MFQSLKALLGDFYRKKTLNKYNHFNIYNPIERKLRKAGSYEIAEV